MGLLLAAIKVGLNLPEFGVTKMHSSRRQQPTALKGQREERITTARQLTAASRRQAGPCRPLVRKHIAALKGTHQQAQ